MDDELDRRVRRLRERVGGVANGISDGDTELLRELFEELTISLEELEVASEELRERNEELLAAHDAVDAERGRFEDLFEGAPLGYLVTDPDGVIIEVNRAACEMFGRERRSLVDKPMVLVIHSADRRRFLRVLSSVAAQSEGGEFELLADRTRSAPFHASLTARVEPADGDREASVRWAIVDVSARKEADDRLTQAELRYRLLVEEGAGVSYIRSMDGSHGYVSPQVTALVGVEPEAILADPSRWTELIEPEDRDRVEARRREHVDGGSPLIDEYRLRNAEDEVVWVRDEAVLSRSRGSEPRLSQGRLSDITARRAAEDEVDSQQRASAVALDREARVTGFWQEDAHRKELLMSALAHDMRGPLSTILGFAETLTAHGDQLGAPDRLDMLERIEGRARKLEALVQDLLSVRRFSGEPREAPAEQDILSQVPALIEEADLARPVDVRSPDALVASIDRLHFGRILVNLLSNAARHTPDGTTIVLRIERATGGVVVSVEDAGAGVPTERREEVFEPGPSGASDLQGSGVGLHIVSGFAEDHGGRAWVEEGSMGGAIFKVFLAEGYGETRAREEAGDRLA